MDYFSCDQTTLTLPPGVEAKVAGCGGQGLLSGFIGSNHITYDGPAEWAVPTTFAPPLLDGTFIAHAHVTTHVQHTVNRTLVADSAFSSTASCSCCSICPLLHCCCRVQSRIRCSWHRLWTRRNTIICKTLKKGFNYYTNNCSNIWV